MEAHSKKTKRTRGGRLIAGALVGTVLSLGAVAGSAAADTTPAPVKVAVVVKTPSGVKLGGGVTSAFSGIRW